MIPMIPMAIVDAWKKGSSRCDHVEHFLVLATAVSVQNDHSHSWHTRRLDLTDGAAMSEDLRVCSKHWITHSLSSSMVPTSSMVASSWQYWFQRRWRCLTESVRIDMWDTVKCRRWSRMQSSAVNGVIHVFSKIQNPNPTNPTAEVSTPFLIGPAWAKSSVWPLQAKKK